MAVETKRRAEIEECKILGWIDEDLINYVLVDWQFDE